MSKKQAFATKKTDSGGTFIWPLESVGFLAFKR